MIVITGGSGSGKSLFGEKLAAEYKNVLYIATAAVTDEEMEKRIAIHQQRRPGHWDTFEGYENLPAVLEEKSPQYDCILLECLTTWCTNLLFRDPSLDLDTMFFQVAEEILQEASRLIGAIKKNNTQCIIITNEVGLGIVPETKLGRNFRDLQGKINQLFLQEAAKAYFVVGGQPVLLKETKEYTEIKAPKYKLPIGFLKPFFLAVGFFTVFPLPFDLEPVEDRHFAKSLYYLPFVGLLIGFIQYACFMLAAQFLPIPAATAFTLFIGILCTGGFHLDGLADTWDALFSGQSREKKLVIMKDSRIGTHGSLALIMDILFRYSLFLSAPSPVVFLLTPIAGRLATPVLSFRAENARKSGLGNLFIGKVPTVQLGWNILFTCLMCYGFSYQWQPLFAVGVVILGLWLFKKYITTQLGGVTGDILGAGVELAEILFLLSITLLEGM